VTDEQTSLPLAPKPEPVAAPPAAGVRLDVDRDNLAWIVFDLPGSKVNVLNTRVMETLRGLIDQASRHNARALIFVSDKPDMFLAGADVEEIAGITDPQDGAAKAAYGQSVFEAVESFSAPTLAVITGPCLGGGYELALACALRIAEDKPQVRIGLPEVKLGVIPGFGGTQRLPRRVGIRAALDMILAGRTLPARPAFRKGFVDALVPPGLGRQVAREISGGARELVAREPDRVDRALHRIAPLRTMVLNQVRTRLARRTRPEHYPAPFLALDAVAAGFGSDEVAAYRTEARLLGEAVVSPASKNLTWLFRAGGRAKQPVDLDLDLGRKSKRLAVVGAGVMGGGIAWLAGEKQLPIRVKDIRPEALEGALAVAAGLWSKAVRRRRLTPVERDRRLEQLSFTLDYRGFGQVDFAVEAVIEDLKIKRQVVDELERVLPDAAVVATNTSSLKVDDIAADARRPERVVGLHFFNPVDRMPLVEVIGGPRSAPWAEATAFRLALDLGKTPILVRDGPGFLVNRLLAFYLGEALSLFETGAEPGMLDRTLTDFGMPMGPFALLDQIGLDVGDKVTKVVKAAYGDRLATSASVARLAAEGHFGKKSGRGFYTYEAGGARGKPSSEAHAAAGSPRRRVYSRDEILDRLLLPMVNEAARCLAEGTVLRPLDVDLGMVLGTGFPAFHGGLLRWADRRGVPHIVQHLESLAGSAPRFAPSKALVERRAGFYAEA